MWNCRVIIALLVVINLFGCKTTGVSEKEFQGEQPNIIVFMVDDMGWQDTSVPFWEKRTPFNDIYETPNMERLASEGMKFTQAYASAVCSPTRISFMTGMNAAKHRVTNWTLRKDQVQPMETSHKKLRFPRWNVNGVSPVAGDSLAVYATTLPQVLSDEGYHTIHVGKAHYGAIGTPGADPLQLGYKVNIAGHAAGGPGSYYGVRNFGNGQEGKEVWAIPGLEKYHGEEIFLTEALTLEAIEAIDSSIMIEKPFFLNMAHYAIHSPITSDPRFIQKYLDKGMNETEAKYASMIEGMDKSLGDIMDYLSQKDLAENTIILFMSDNGGLSAVARGGEPHSHNQPLSSGKGSVHEGGIRVPMIVKWTGKVAAGSVTDQPVIIEDFYPTILALAGIDDYQTVQEIDGVNFLPILRNEEVPKREFYWHYPNEWGPTGPGIGAYSAIRDGDWKFIYYHADRTMELFNIEEDIGESNNQIHSEEEKGKELAIKLTAYLKESNAQMPVSKSTGEQVVYPDEAFEKKSDDFFINNEFLPVEEDNLFKTDDYFNWGASILKGEDGKYHLFYSRWERKFSFTGWLTHSEIAHATSSSPMGPWTYKETVLTGRGKGSWDAITAHNPKIKYFDGKYYLYYISTNMGDQNYTSRDLLLTANTGYDHPNWPTLRTNQRTGVAVSNSINGPWERMEQPLIEPSGPITTLTVNPAIEKGPDGKFYLIVKGDKPDESKFVRNQAMAISDRPERGFIVQDKAVIDYLDTEDMSLWYDEARKRFYGVFHAHSFIGLVTSTNGLDWEKAGQYRLSDKIISKQDGQDLIPDRMERPFLYTENGEPVTLSVAVRKGNESFTVFIPIK